MKTEPQQLFSVLDHSDLEHLKKKYSEKVIKLFYAFFFNQSIEGLCKSGLCECLTLEGILSVLLFPYHHPISQSLSAKVHCISVQQ